MLRYVEVAVRLANPPSELVAKYTRKEREFFFDYSTYVLRLFNSPEVQQQLRGLIEAENVHVSKSVDVRIMAFPARPLHGRPRNVLRGSYNHDNAQISIYPLKINRSWVRQEGFSTFRAPATGLNSSQRDILREVYVSSLSTLIHEVLHVKFEDRGLSRYAEEGIVRKLEKQYSEEWLERLPPNTAESLLPIIPEP